MEVIDLWRLPVREVLLYIYIYIYTYMSIVCVQNELEHVSSLDHTLRAL